MCVCVCVCVCVRARARACVRACVRACMSACMRACLCVERERERAAVLGRSGVTNLCCHLDISDRGCSFFLLSSLRRHYQEQQH